MKNTSNTATSSASSVEEQEPGRRLNGLALISVVAALMLTILLEALDQTIVGTAMPRIIGTLQGFDRYTWVVTAYVLASTTMIPVVGKLSDQFGRKWFLLIGTVVFLLGSFLSGAAQNIDELIIFRALQGLGAGIGIALVVTVVGDIFAPAERAKWQGAFGSVYGLANLIGPTLGGWLTDHGPLLGGLVTDATRWRWVFYINLPIGILALAALLIFLPANLSERDTRYHGWAAVRRIDFVGSILAAAATICLLLGLTWGGDQTYAWNSAPVIGTLVASGVLFVAFIIAERFVAEPILPLDLFRSQVFSSAALLSLLQMVILMGLVLYLPFFLQGVLGESATNSGFVITPLTVSMVIGAMAAGFVISALKRYQVVTIVGALVMTVGVFLMTRMTAATSIGETVIYMVLAGIGCGVFFGVLTLAAQNSLPRRRLGVGTGAIRYVGQLGATLGIAVIGTVVNQTLSDDVSKRLPPDVIRQLTPAGVKAATNPQVLVNQDYRNGIVHTAQQIATQHIPAGPQHDIIAQQVMQQVQHLLGQVFDALKESFVVALQHGFIAVLIFCGIAVIATFFLKDLPMKQRSEIEPSKEEETEDEEEPVGTR